MGVPRSQNSESATRILIILPRQMGDVVLGLPMIHELRRFFPEAQIFWVAHPLATEVLEGHPELDGVFYLPQGKQAYVTARAGVLGRIEKAIGQLFLEFKFFQSLRKFAPHVVIDAMNNPRTSLLAFISGAPKRVSFRTRFQRNILFTDLIDRVELSQGYLGISRLNLLGPLQKPMKSGCTLAPVSVSALTGIEKTSLDSLMIHRTKQQEEKVTNVLASFDMNLNMFPFVIVCPVHRREVRRWPKEFFQELARLLVLRHGIAVVWLWGPGEETFVRPLHEGLKLQIKHAALKHKGAMTYFLPLLTIKEAAELSSRALCWVGNSSGLGHIAVAAGCRTVEIHGPTNPIPWTHPDRTKHRSVTRNTGCLSCERNSCKLQHRECLEDLSPAVVLREIEDLLMLSPKEGISE